MPCSEFYNSEKQSCSKVAHPYCILKQNLKTDNESKWDLTVQQTPEKTLMHALCPTHIKKKVNCYGCRKDPEMTPHEPITSLTQAASAAALTAQDKHAEITWISYDFCNVWYHDICVKRKLTQLNRGQKVILDDKASFKCELCRQFSNFILGEPGQTLDQQLQIAD